MAFRNLDLKLLIVNRANDRHGELENETAAIAWLFNNGETHMRNLARDIAKQCQIYEAPLVCPEVSGKFIIFDGNRRITCAKLIHDPRRAPTVELQEFFEHLKSQTGGKLPSVIGCQIEDDRDHIDEILFRRHTGSQGGVGQSNWDDRMKLNFINRTGKESGYNVAGEIEKKLQDAGALPASKKVPWSTMNRLFSSEAFRNRAGFTFSNRQFEYTHQPPVVIKALAKIAADLANKRVVLGDLWDVDGKRTYLDRLEIEGVLPRVEHAVHRANPALTPSKPTARPTPRATPYRRVSLIPDSTFAIAWSGRLQRHRAIWEELQFHLRLSEQPNAISVLFRVLLELSVENYIAQTRLQTVKTSDTLARKSVKVAEDLFSKGKIDKRYFDMFGKFPQYDSLVSADTLNRYVHSPNFAPSPEHLTALWDTLANFVVNCLNA